MKRSLFVLATLATIIPMAAAQSLFNNGTNGRTNVTGPEGLATPGGLAAPAGFRNSEVGSGGTIAGYGAQGAAVNNRVADNFTNGVGWNVTSVVLFMYQTGGTGQIGSAGSINGATVSIQGDAAGAPDGVDQLTGTFVRSTYTDMYRIFNGTAGTTRQIQRLDINMVGSLSAGNHWLVFQAVGALASGPWAPYVANSTPANGFADGSANAMQSIGGGAWAAVTDGGRQQDLPFYINGTPVPEPASMAILGLGAAALLRRRRKA